MAHSERWYSSPTQVYWTCEALMNGRVITHKSEIREVKGWRLGAIIHRLKSDYGWPIVTELRGVENIAHYSLARGTDVFRLRFPPSAQSLCDRLEGGAA